MGQRGQFKLSLVFSVSALLGVAQSPKGLDEVPRSSYTLGPDDQITIHSLEVEELSEKSFRIGATGVISLPMVGRVQAAGLTVEQLEAELAKQLKPYFKEPSLSISVAEMRSQPVSVIGSVANPGVHQLQGRKTLVEILSLAGGLKGDAGYSVKITRRIEWGPIPLPAAKEDPSGQFNVAEVGLRGIIDASNPAGNIPIMPNDVISVPRAEMVYVIGEVGKQGSIVLGDERTVSVLRALSIAAGLSKTAKPREAKILRVTPGSSARLELPVDLKAILAGKIGDVPMQAEDILFVPNSLRKEVAIKSMEALIGNGPAAVIYRIP